MTNEEKLTALLDERSRLRKRLRSLADEILDESDFRRERPVAYLYEQEILGETKRVFVCGRLACRAYNSRRGYMTVAWLYSGWCQDKTRACEVCGRTVRMHRPENKNQTEGKK